MWSLLWLAAYANRGNTTPTPRWAIRIIRFLVWMLILDVGLIVAIIVTPSWLIR